MSKKLIKKCLPGAIIVKSDNTRVASPVIEEKPIYIQPQSKQTYVSADYRSPWLLQQDLKKAEIAYNMYIDEKNKELALQHALGLAAIADAVMFVPDATDLITKGIKYAGKKYLLRKNAKLVSSLLDGTPTITPIANNVGWGPRYTGQVVHKSKSNTPLVLYNPKRWDVVNEGANPHGVWYLGEWGVPRTVANATEEKAEKAARARAIFEERPYAHEGELVLEKPIITVGEVPDRSALSYQADALGADGLIYNDVYDNGYNNNQVILSFKHHNPQALVKWYGPTMGKTTASKTNVNLVDIDPLLKPIRAKHAERLGLKISDAKVSSDPAYKQEVADFVLDWRLKPENKGKTLVASTKHLLDPKYKIPFDNNPVIPDLETFIARNKARGFRESEEELRNWYNSIFLQSSNIQIDNRFVSDLESALQFNTSGNKEILIGNRLYDFSNFSSDELQQLILMLQRINGDKDLSLSLLDKLKNTRKEDLAYLLQLLGLYSLKDYGMSDVSLLFAYLSPLPEHPTFQRLVNDLSEANYRAFKKAIPNLPERVFTDVNPFLESLPNYTPNSTINSAVIHDIPMDVLGELGSNELDQFWANEILERLRAYTLDPQTLDQIQPILMKGNRTLVTPSKVIASVVDEPITIYKSLHPTDVAGFFNISTGQSFADVNHGMRNGVNALLNTRHHEVVRHGTEDIVNHYGVNEDYEQLFEFFMDTSGFLQKNSAKPYELRATLGEVLNYGIMAKLPTSKNPKEALDSFLNWLNNLDDDKLVLTLKSFLANVNDYGRDYARALTKEGAKYIRQLMNSAPALAGVGYVIDLETDSKPLYKTGGRLIPKHAKGSPVNTNPLPEMPVNTNPIPKKKKLFEIDLKVVGLRPTPGLLTFPKGNGNGLYMVKRNE